MTQIDLYNTLTKLLPVTDDSDEQLHLKLRNVLNIYIEKINEYRQNNNDISDDNFKKTLTVCKKLIEIQRDGIKGLHSAAFTKLRNLIENTLSNVGIINDDKSGSVYYRMRKAQTNRKCFNYSEMFHIPLNSRQMVKTQRFSAPGFPCLYVANSIYGAWEEMGRPLIDDCMVSALKTQKKTDFIDLRIPQEEEFTNTFEEYIVKWPLIIACMMDISQDDDYHKAEYFIPQLLMEFIIYFNNKYARKRKTLYGIKYTSVHINNDFDYPLSKLDNWAVPVINPLRGKKHCPKLAETFLITNSTYFELEKLKGNVEQILDPGDFDTMTKEKKYQQSLFHDLETALLTDFHQITD